jgi:two-component system chemotaxis response regulator CheB
VTSPTRRIRVLVVDDSVVIRRLVTEVLATDQQIEVIGTASNGRIALTKVRDMSPDLVTMDVEMPEMNGIEAVRALRGSHPRLPVIMFSTLTERGATATLDALAAGARDYITKPSNVGSLDEGRRSVAEQLIPKIKALVQLRAHPTVRAQPRPVFQPPTRRRIRSGMYSVLAIGCSTGGPDALATLLSALPGDLPVPVAIVQHMPPVFTRLLSERLDHICALRVSEAAAGDVLVPGRVLIAPGGVHTELRRQGTSVVVRLTEEPPENYCRPAVDVLFRSVAATYGESALGLVLTGMGRDGQQGARAIRDAGGEIYVQDEATSVVWGMPGAVVAAAQADQVLALDQLGPRAVAALSRHTSSAGV